MNTTTSPVRAEPNVTPMIDVMLVLLIIFMTVAPLLAVGFPATPPSGRHLSAHPDDDGDATIGLDRLGRFYFNKRPIAEGSLTGLLKEHFAKSPDDRVVFLRADQALAYWRVQATITIATDAGARVIGLVSEQPAAAASNSRSPR